MTGVVSLVGAGPGDPRLLTLRGAELLQRADVVVHDRLAPPALLDLAPSSAELVDVGKAPGLGPPQSRICEGVTTFSSSPAEAVMTLKVEPGS